MAKADGFGRAPRGALQAAVACYERGDLAEAQRLAEQAAREGPSNADAANLLGVIALRGGDASRALQHFRRAAELSRSNPEVFFNCGVAAGALQRWEDALSAYERTLKLWPSHAMAWNNRGNVLQQIGRLDAALSSYERALAIQPAYPNAARNRAALLHRLGRWNEARAAYGEVLRVQPRDAEALASRAAILREMDEAEAALADYDALVALDPANDRAHVERAFVLQDLARWDEALDSFAKALQANPACGDAEAYRAVLLLLRGDFERGWPAYESRWKAAAMQADEAHFTAPLWLGKESPAGKTLLVHAEQGFGDTIQFGRYVPRVAERAARVIFHVSPALFRLLREALPGVEVAVHGEPHPVLDFHTPLLSLPLAFGTTLESIPPPLALRADEGRAQAWRTRLGEPSAKRVGVAWAGSAGHANDRRRSVPFERFSRLFGQPFEFHVLQKERVPEAEISAKFPHVRVWSSELRDFSETAALIAELDLVVCVDTAVAHIAASMGKPVWLLLPSVPDFRWLLERNDSPWYPGMRLFRQPRGGDWESVLDEVRGALAEAS